MRIIQLLLLILLTTVFSSFSMDSVAEENNFDKISTDLLPTILIRQDHQYPWHNFIHAHKLKDVCKLWRDVIGDPDVLASKLNIPLMHCAAMMNQPEKIIELKLAGHSPLAPDTRGLVPMNYAFECRQPDALTMLRIGFAVAQHITCARQGYSDVLKIIQTPWSNDQYTEETLTAAIKDKNYTQIVTILSNNLNLCNNLITSKQTKSIYCTNITNLIFYVAQCKIECDLFFIKKENFDRGFFKLFMKFNANPNAYNEDGETFLHRIVRQKSLLPTVQQLLQLKNINLNLPHLLYGYNAVYACAAAGNVECLKLLLETKKTKKEPFFDSDHDALNCAISHRNPNCDIIANRLACVQLLIESGAGINRLDTHNGYAPLHYAATYGNSNAIELLIQHGANKHLKTKYGKTALDLARERNRLEVVKLLS